MVGGKRGEGQSAREDVGRLSSGADSAQMQRLWPCGIMGRGEREEGESTREDVGRLPSGEDSALMQRPCLCEMMRGWGEKGECR